jgi:hypothetical protein
MRGLYPRRQTPHPSAMLRIASTLSHKGRGEESAGVRRDDALRELRRQIRHHGIEHRKSGLRHPQSA